MNVVFCRNKRVHFLNGLYGYTGFTVYSFRLPAHGHLELYNVKLWSITLFGSYMSYVQPPNTMQTLMPSTSLPAISQSNASGELDHSHSLLQLLSSFAELADNFKRCLSATAVPDTLSLGQPAKSMHATGISEPVLPLLQNTPNIIPENCFKEALACEILLLVYHLANSVNEKKIFGEANMLTSFLYCCLIKKITWIK